MSFFFLAKFTFAKIVNCREILFLKSEVEKSLLVFSESLREVEFFGSFRQK